MKFDACFSYLKHTLFFIFFSFAIDGNLKKLNRLLMNSTKKTRAWFAFFYFKILGLALFCPQIGWANLELEFEFDTIVKIKEVNIISSRLKNFTQGNKILKFDSTTLLNHSHKNIGDLLTDESGIFIKSYGISSLATSSFRGGSSSHTAIVWNNLNINSPMNGLLDFSLMSVSFFNDVQIQYGGSSALWGSGAIGGAIHLNNKMYYNQGTSGSAQVTVGSFGNFSQQGNVVFSKKRWVSQTSITHQRAQNNFAFTNYYLPNAEKQKQQHAEMKGFGLMNHNQLKINEKNEISISYWHQQMQRNLPPTLLQNNSFASQNDFTHRLAAAYNFNHKKLKTNIRSAFFDEVNNFVDLAAKIDALNKAKSFINEIENTIDFSKNRALNLGVNNSFYSSSADGYSQKTQNRLGLFGSYQFVNNKQNLYATLSVRQEFIDSKLAPFTGSLSVAYKTLPWLSLYANAAKVYRVPTFNDLFWTPGGNPNLFSENGYSQDLGLKINYTKGNWNFKNEATFFNKNIKDWIIWLPGSSYWEPQNIQKVWSRGIEKHLSFTYAKNDWKIGASALGTYVLSTNQVAKSANDASVGKQLIYVPKFNGLAKLDFHFKNFQFTYRHNYNSKRFTTTDNFAFLPAFHLGSVQTSYTFQSAKASSRFFVELNNILNHEYQAIQNRPMPLRHFNTGFSFTFK